MKTGVNFYRIINPQMINKISKFVCALVLIFISIANTSIAQSAGSVSDAQLLQIIAAANQRGMSPQEVAMYAKSKGYSDADVSNLMQRANGMTGNSKINGQTSASLSSQRQTVQFADNDLMKSGSDTATNLTEEEKRIFGFEVFHNKGISFTPNLNMATPKDYVVGPGDELIAQIYGIAEATINLKVSPEGKIAIPNVGVAHVGGLNIEAVKIILTNKIGTRYAGLGGTNPNSFLMVTLSNIRSIRINIVGEVKTPGTYQLPSFTTSFNALYAAGGPTAKGSFRNIQVYRAGKQIAEVDLYEFLLKGKTDKNIRLEDNDVLLVPQYGKRVEIAGEVRRNLFFEVKDKETISNLIEMASGFTTNAYKKMITIQRYNGNEKSILNLDEKEQSNINLLDGDYVIVGKNPSTYKNRIQIIGAVEHPGDFELKSNIKISDLINEAGGLKMEAFRARAILYRTNIDFQKTELSIDLNKALVNDPSNNLQLNKEDVLVISSIYDIKENYFVSIQGEVNQVGTFPYSKGMTVSELILKAKGFKESASGSSIEIVRRVRDNANEIAKVVKVDINKDLSIGANDKTTTLEPFDQVYIRASVGFRDLKKVYVQGEANYTGQFVMDKANMTVGNLVKRAGGVLPSANINGALLIRRTIFYKKDANTDDYLQNLLELRSRYQDSTKSGFTEIDNIHLKQINQQIEELYLKKYKSEEKSTEIGNLGSQSPELKTKQDSINKKQRVKTEQENIEELKTALQARVFKNLRDVSINEDQYQFVSINLAKIMNTNGVNKYDLQLQEGDILYIPTYNETVVVSGDVLYPVAVKYNEETTLNDYVNQAGGFNNTALRKRAYVVEANGSVKRTRNFLWFKFYPSVGPGSMVFVPKNNKPASNLSIDRVLGLVSSLVTTYLLVKNLTK
jgi:protein involved in polysaccharide export with SLBB domain